MDFANQNLPAANRQSDQQQEWPDLLPAADTENVEGEHQQNMQGEHQAIQQHHEQQVTLPLDLNLPGNVTEQQQSADRSNNQQQPQMNQQVQEQQLNQDQQFEHVAVDTEITVGPEAEPEQRMMIFSAAEDQAKSLTTKRPRAKDILFRRKRFHLLKFVHNRIIEITYKRSRSKKRKTIEANPTPVTTQGLRRSSRLMELNEGHKAVTAGVNTSSQPQSACHTQGMQQVCSLATDSVLSAQHMFEGLEKFPTAKEIEESITPLPEISIQAIQKVAVEECGLSPEEVVRELLLLEKEHNASPDMEGDQAAAAQNTEPAH